MFSFSHTFHCAAPTGREPVHSLLVNRSHGRAVDGRKNGCWYGGRSAGFDGGFDGVAHEGCCVVLPIGDCRIPCTAMYRQSGKCASVRIFRRAQAAKPANSVAQSCDSSSRVSRWSMTLFCSLFMSIATYTAPIACFDSISATEIFVDTHVIATTGKTQIALAHTASRHTIPTLLHVNGHTRHSPLPCLHPFRSAARSRQSMRCTNSFHAGSPRRPAPPTCQRVGSFQPFPPETHRSC